jgi:CheY-like chemotaxis protein
MGSDFFLEMPVTLSPSIPDPSTQTGLFLPAFFLNDEGVIEHASHAACQRLQSASSELLGREIPSVLPWMAEGWAWPPPQGRVEGCVSGKEGLFRFCLERMTSGSGVMSPVAWWFQWSCEGVSSIGAGPFAEWASDIRPLLSGGLAHDFNNVLNIVVGFTQLAQKEGQSSRRRRYLDNVLEAAERASELVHQLISFSRDETWTMFPLSLRPLMKGIGTMMHNALDDAINLQVSFDVSEARILGNPSALYALFQQLSNRANQLREPSSGGTLHLSFDLPLVLPGPLRNKGRFLHVCCKDGFADSHGGVSGWLMSTTYAPKGNGWDLSVMDHIVRQHQGFFRPVSLKDQTGTAFHFYFPLMKAEDHIPPGQSPKGSPWRILIVDDERSLLELFHESLTQAGFDVVSFDSSRQALAYFQEHGEEVDLLMTDLVMPDLSGWAFIQEVRKQSDSLPILICSGFLQPKDVEKIKTLRVDEVLQKPVLLPTLLGILSNTLRAPKARNR